MHLWKSNKTSKSLAWETSLYINFGGLIKLEMKTKLPWEPVFCCKSPIQVPRVSFQLLRLTERLHKAQILSSSTLYYARGANVTGHEPVRETVMAGNVRTIGLILHLNGVSRINVRRKPFCGTEAIEVSCLMENQKFWVVNGQAPGEGEAVVSYLAIVIEIDAPKEAGDVVLAGVINREFLYTGPGTVLNHCEINDEVFSHVIHIALGFHLG